MRRVASSLRPLSIALAIAFALPAVSSSALAAARTDDAPAAAPHGAPHGAPTADGKAGAAPAKAGEHGAAHDDGHGGGIVWTSPILGNNGKMGLLWILINFAVLMWLLEKLLFSKLRARTAAKSDDIKSQLDRATAARQAAESVMSDVRKRLDRMDKEVGEILDEAKSRAEADRKRIVAAAEAEAAAIREAARAAGEREAEVRRRAIEREIVESAIVRAEALLRERFGAADQRRMVEDFIRQAEATPLRAEGGPS